MNLVRLGHYFTPRGEGSEGTITGSCQTALICGVNANEGTAEDGGGQPTVNLHVWQIDGDSLGARTNVAVETPAEGHASFHLSGECPWNR